MLNTDEQFSHRFDVPGAYKYFYSNERSDSAAKICSVSALIRLRGLRRYGETG